MLNLKCFQIHLICVSLFQVVTCYLSFLCARLLDLRNETRAARVIQEAWRKYRLKKDLKLYQVTSSLYYLSKLLFFCDFLFGADVISCTWKNFSHLIYPLIWYRKGL